MFGATSFNENRGEVWKNFASVKMAFLKVVFYHQYFYCT